MKKGILFILALIATLFGQAQISHGGQPSSKTEALLSLVDTKELPAIDVTTFKNEDNVTDQHKDIPWRFGIVRSVNFDLQNAGTWETLSNGDRLWRLTIKSPGALSLNLNFNAFILPEGATFFVYNKNQTLGAFNHLNNKQTGEFSTAPIKGQEITLEYFEPQSKQGQGQISVESVVHGYRDFFKQLKTFGSSGGCNVNAICDTTFWGNEIRSSVMILTAGNSRFCSGALIANVPKDGTPYILTANHCGPATNNIFMFNYQSNDCLNSVDGPTSQTISGCVQRANYSPSDFYLVELSSTPPSNYNVYYSGWSSIDVPASNSTGIHHPRGDVKKISHDYNPSISSGYQSSGNDHWKVADWDSGTTEPSSSGSPLYDQNHRIIGQLHGGTAACGNDSPDFYGKFSYSWDTHPSNSNQLKFWLDPGNTGTTVMDGYDPNGPQFTTDAVLLNIRGISSFECGDSIRPIVTIRNHGSASLTSVDVNYQIDGGGVSQINWTGNLPAYGIDSIILPALFVSSGDHEFKAFCTNPNSTTDNNTLNDTSTVNFKSNANPTFATIHLNTDNYGSETSWIIRDSNGDIYLQSGGYNDVNGGEQITESLCLYDGCFTAILQDQYGDGFCCSFGNGSFYLVDNLGDTIGSTTTFATDSILFPFCLNNNSIEEFNQDDFQLYPNPSNGLITIETASIQKYDLTVVDVLGNILLNKQITESRHQLDLSHQAKGIYFAIIQTPKNRMTKRLILH